jgi:hypothetical protein
MIEKLIRIQSELKAPKGQTNAFGKYKYRSCEDIIEAVKPLLARERLLMTISDEIVEVGGRVYVKATVNLCDGATVMFTTTASPVCMSLQPVAPKGSCLCHSIRQRRRNKEGHGCGTDYRRGKLLRSKVRTERHVRYRRYQGC